MSLVYPCLKSTVCRSYTYFWICKILWTFTFCNWSFEAGYSVTAYLRMTFFPFYLNNYVVADCWHELMPAGVTHQDSWGRVIQRWLVKNRFWVSQASVVREEKKVHKVMFKLITEVTGDKFLPFLVDASAELLHPRTCACMYIFHLLVIVSESVPWLTLWNVSVHGVAVFHFCWSHHLITYEHLSIVQKFWYQRS